MDSFLNAIMTINYKNQAIPLFLVIMAIEAWICAKENKKTYRLNDTISSLSCGLISLFMNLGYAWALFFIYQFAYFKWALFDWSNASLTVRFILLIFLIFAIDLAYYFGHRFTHTVNIGWAGHVTHHSSEEYNYSTALRQSGLETFVTFMFYLPLAILGIPFEWYISLSSLNTVYQFWVHTKHINHLPRWFSFLFNTPSHHRVHHARNQRYLDKNFGGMFIIWDRIFKTFEPESEQAIFGITKPLNSWNPLKAQFHYLNYLLVSTTYCSGIKKLLLFFKKPGWLEENILPNTNFSVKLSYEKYDPFYSAQKKLLSLGLFGFATITGLWGIFYQANSLLIEVLLILCSIICLIAIGRIMENKRLL